MQNSHYFTQKSIENDQHTNTLHQITLKIQNNEYFEKSELGQKLKTRPTNGKHSFKKQINNDFYQVKQLV